MYVPVKHLWRENEIPEFYNFISPFLDKLKTDLLTKAPEIESEILSWNSSFDTNPLGLKEVYKNRVQTFNKEKNKFEPNTDGKRLINFSYTFIDNEHYIKSKISTDNSLIERYPTAYQLVDLLGEKCQRLSYVALAPQTTQFKTVIPEYRFTDNTVARIYVPIMVPDGKVTFCHMPAIGVGVTMEILSFDKIFVQDVQRFYEIKNETDQWLVFVILDIERKDLGLPPGEAYQRDYGRSMWVI